MAVANHALALIAMVFMAGSLTMLFFVILSAVDSTSPLRDTYFLRADTSSISGARDISQWTYFYVCGDGNSDCSRPVAGLPLGYAWDGNPAQPPPAELLGDYGDGTTSYYYWYMWRFGWVFFLITLFFEVLAFFTGFVACCGRLGSAIAAFMSAVSLVFFSIAVSLMTAVFVKMRNVFLDNGRDATLGRYAFGFSWGAWAALLVATVLYCTGIRKVGGGDHVSTRRNWTSFRRNRSTRSRKSQDVGSRRVKEEYA